jgi:uncharacterized protein (TIGR03083 family)
VTDADELARLLDGERSRLVSTLGELDDAQWRAPSLCEGWRVREVVVHLLMPHQLSPVRFLLLMARTRFDFDAVADRWARQDPRPLAELIDALRATAGQPFRVPGAPPEAPLSHLVIHAEDVYRPLGLERGASGRAAEVVLGQLTTGRGRGLAPAGLLDAVALRATDADWRHGEGPEVHGPASALITVLAGRRAGVDDLAGEGVARVRECLRAP